MTRVMVVMAPDPYIALMYKKFYDQNWKDEVDGLLVQVNGCNREVVDFIADLYKDETVIKHYDHSNQGIGFDELIKLVPDDTDVLMTTCSDNFIFQKGVVKNMASNIGMYDVVGSTGLHASPPDVADEIKDKIGFCRVNPFMSFWNYRKLKEIDFTFQAVDKRKGSLIESLNYECQKDVGLDVMTEMSIKYMSLGNKALVINDDDPPKYIHASGLSSAVYGHLVYPDGVNNLAGTTRNSFDCRISKDTLAWLLTCYLETWQDCPLEEFNADYWEALIRKIKRAGSSLDEIKALALKRKELWQS